MVRIVKKYKFLLSLTIPMNWENAAFRILRERFGNTSFYAAEAIDLLRREKGYRPGTTYRVLRDLLDSGKLLRVGYGVYRARKPGEGVPASPRLPPSMERVRKLLLERGVEFMITGPSVLYGYMHSLPRRMIHLAYTVKGSGEYVAKILGEEFETLVNPSEAEVNVALSVADKDVVVVRGFSGLYGGRDGVASLERALVDLYFESTRHRIPFPTDEAGRILFSALRNAKIDYSRLNRSASRRGVDGELRAIIKELGVDAPARMMKNTKRNKHVNSVLNALRRGV